jgi:hypothetical protein
VLVGQLPAGAVRGLQGRRQGGLSIAEGSGLPQVMRQDVERIVSAVEGLKSMRGAPVHQLALRDCQLRVGHLLDQCVGEPQPLPMTLDHQLVGHRGRQRVGHFGGRLAGNGREQADRKVAAQYRGLPQ